jgi:hypothetical protein
LIVRTCSPSYQSDDDRPLPEKRLKP